MFCATESKTVNCVDQHVAAVANQLSEHDVRAATSSDDVTHTSQVTSSTDKCQQLRAPASLPLWIYCTRYTDRPPGGHYIALLSHFVNPVHRVTVTLSSAYYSYARHDDRSETFLSWHHILSHSDNMDIYLNQLINFIRR